MEEGRGWVDGAVVDVDDERSFWTSEGAKGREEFDDVGFVRGVAARCAPEFAFEGALLAVDDDKSGVGIVCHF